MKVTLRDIAKRTGFSVNTVSHALCGKTDISAATREEICRVAEEMGYVGNRTASSLRSGRSRAIAVILPDLANPHFIIILRGIEAFFRARGYSVFVQNTDEDAEIEAQGIRAALGQNVDGILLCPAAGGARNLSYLKRADIPFTLIGRHCPECPTDYVVCDDEQGGYLAASHLLRRGHREIAYFNTDPRISSAEERFAGIRRALAETGRALPPDRICTLGVRAGGNRAQIRDFLTAHREVTGIVAFSDLLAYETICALGDLGLRTPDDLSVIGFDNICSDYALPVALSSVSLFKKTMARAAAELLWQKIQGNAEERHIVLPSALVERDTVRDIAPQATV